MKTEPLTPEEHRHVGAEFRETAERMGKLVEVAVITNGKASPAGRAAIALEQSIERLRHQLSIVAEDAGLAAEKLYHAESDRAQIVADRKVAR